MRFENYTDEELEQVIKCKRFDITHSVNDWDSLSRWLLSNHGKKMSFLYFTPTERNTEIFEILGTLATLDAWEMREFLNNGVICTRQSHILVVPNPRDKYVRHVKLDVYREY